MVVVGGWEDENLNYKYKNLTTELSVASSMIFNTGSRKQVTNIFAPKFTLRSQTLLCFHRKDREDQDMAQKQEQKQNPKMLHLKQFLKQNMEKAYQFYLHS